MKARNFAGAIALLLVAVLPFVVPRIGHVETWKIILGLAGLVIFVRAGMSKD